MRKSLILTTSILLASVACAAPVNTESDGVDSSIPSGEDVDIVNTDLLGAVLDAYYLKASTVNIRGTMKDVDLMLANTNIDSDETSGDIPETDPAVDTLEMDTAEAPELSELVQLLELEDVDTSSFDTSVLEDTADGVVPSKRQMSRRPRRNKATPEKQAKFHKELAMMERDGVVKMELQG
ncbi:hypothetical protein CkaCkLH20_00334 [Colletotrichum karsti]|uniref:Uncharacterized protein n=1 Tax=Colletotrichum karsti TaxID=1095194 RepID=A0A9P6LQF9_9PEZI|nr:uncharacterized protein CkaCkLH20_00334 [Colletotrichum karsti]KAF9882298.1 hypothetical protein CkaCkLH20_00334 [Colletotrichum karsti]